jgi:hypothetical protein
MANKRIISVVMHIECQVTSEYDDDGKNTADPIELAEAVNAVAHSFKANLQDGVIIVHSHMLAEPWNPNAGDSGETQ